MGNLPACPYCKTPGSRKNCLRESYVDDGRQYAVHCGACGAIGPYASTKRRAIEAYSRRPSPWVPVGERSPKAMVSRPARQGGLMHGKQFRLTEEHLKLLRHAYVRWDNCEFGAPQIDPKRPYGNSDVLGDMRKILSRPAREHDADELESLHLDTETALQIVLRCGAEPGVYVAGSYDQDWRRKED